MWPWPYCTLFQYVVHLWQVNWKSFKHFKNNGAGHDLWQIDRQIRETDKQERQRDKQERQRDTQERQTRETDRERERERERERQTDNGKTITFQVSRLDKVQLIYISVWKLAVFNPDLRNCCTRLWLHRSVVSGDQSEVCRRWNSGFSQYSGVF